MASDSETNILKSELYDAIMAFDGKSTSILGETEARFRQRAFYLDALIPLCSNESNTISSGATWLLKEAHKHSIRLSTDQAAALIDTLPKILDWNAQLHLCQTLESIPVSRESLTKLLEWLRSLIQHKRPFLRAWAVSAFCAVAIEHRHLVEEAHAYLRDARNDAAASVRARVRNITLPQV